MPREFDVAIIGAGASGVLVAAHLSGSSARVALLDAGARAARGLAYGTPYGAHLLNVPAGRMSAYAARPDHFVEWLGAPPATFAPRAVYGEYLAHVLDEAKDVARIFGTAVGLTRTSSAWNVHLHDGRTLSTKAVVLALGNLPPADPLPIESKNYLRDPWAPGAAQGLASGAPILLIGTGLTMIDLVLALRTEGHRGTIHALSRRGLLPRAHAAYEPVKIDVPRAGSPLALLRWMSAVDADWRAVIDALRPVTSSLWQQWTLTQRRSFLRHARPFWDVHRHRTAPEVAAAIEQLIRDGVLHVHHGRIQSIRDSSSGVEVIWNRGSLTVARVINCTGPASDYAAVDLPLVVQLRRGGWLVPDALALGIETNDDGQLLDAGGNAVPGLFTLGPLRRPALWESTAIPEIRAQAAALASNLARTTEKEGNE